MEKLINRFYVYTHRKASDDKIFYVGKGQTNRAYRKDGRNIHWHRIVEKHGYFVVIELSEVTDIEAALYEIQLIALIGRNNLCNQTDGGDGMSGYIHTAAGKQKISETHKGRTHSLESIAKMRASKVGKTVSDETRLKMSSVRKGKKHSFEAISKMRDKALNRKSETIEKQVSANTGLKRSETSLKNMRNAQPGHFVKCSNGMSFIKIILAVEWLRKNGHPKASIPAIARAASEPHRVAYGLKWEITRDSLRYSPKL